jgi:hypothetical protein
MADKSSKPTREQKLNLNPILKKARGASSVAALVDDNIDFPGLGNAPELPKSTKDDTSGGCL